MVSEKMIEAAKCEIVKGVILNTGVAQDVVNAAYHKFEAHQITWPEKGTYALCNTNELQAGMGMLHFNGAGHWLDDDDELFYNVTQYADPIDLLYVSEATDES